VGNKEVVLAEAAIKNGNFSDLERWLRKNQDSITLGLLQNPIIRSAVTNGLESDDINQWIINATTWNPESFGVSEQLSHAEHFLHVLWSALSFKIAKKMETLNRLVDIKNSGSIICFPGGSDFSLLIAFSSVSGSGSFHLRPLSAREMPGGMLDLENYFKNAHPREKNAIKSAVTSVDKIVFHRGTIIHVDRQKENVFGPTIDTIILTEILNSHLNSCDEGDMHSVLEVGPGSGLITTAVATHNKVSRVVSVEINGDAVNCTLKNLKINGIKPSSKLQSISVRAEKFSPQNLGERFDFVVCNPPYIPEDPSIEDFTATGYGLAISGLDLYDQLFKNLNILLNENGQLLIMMSSVSYDLVIKKLPTEFVATPALRGERRRVPLDLDLLWGRPEWKDHLTQEKLIEETTDGEIFHWLIPIWVQRRKDG